MLARPLLMHGAALSEHGFPADHPNAIDRQAVFWSEVCRLGLHEQVKLGAPRLATREELLRFHDESHVLWVQTCSKNGVGYLDDGDTPAFAGVYEAAAARVGSALEALEQIMAGDVKRSFQPAGGMHHARRHRAAGFCPFNDIGVVIETLRDRHGVRRIGYVDIDAHHGDGVYYTYESDAELIFADIHEDGRCLYPGTGDAAEIGKGAAAGTKLNIPMPPRANDRDFHAAWERVEAHLEQHAPEFIILQAGADSLAGDPLADLRFSAASHAHAARRLVALADRHAQGRLMVFGGGGYHPTNVATAWTGVLRALIGNDR
jgi:acetoin utilization protein AcuC